MNLKDAKFKNFALVQEMLETPDVMRRFDFGRSGQNAQIIKEAGRLFLTGEGSSRIFPAKNMMYEVLRLGIPLSVSTEGSRQAHEYDLAGFAVYGASNSGKTKELISLFTQLAKQGHGRRFGLTATPHSMLESASNRCDTLICGPEKAVAATKSVVEQALYYRSILCHLEKEQSDVVKNQPVASAKAREVLEAELDPALVQAIVAAPMIYFAGRNNGVAEELTLKTNEITRKKSDYLEGTYAVHGIEEVMNREDVVIVVDPFPGEAQKFKETLVDNIGMKIIAISAQETIFPTIRIPSVPGYDTVLQLLAGWNVLVNVGIASGINLDKPVRARKIGNEFVG
jgi:glucosamine--fructose-6-phosphate aminotransferase (isomerizing)